jgi:YegS/Rv2252/BmrU family lipid kinase
VKTLAIIHNPGSGSQDDSELDALRARFGEAFTVHTYTVSEEADPGSLAARAVSDGATVLVASGGDGTVSGVVSAIVGRSDLTLGIIPRGTGNSVATCLGIPTDLDGASATILAGHTRCIDTARVGERTMVLMACVGLHADAITETADEAKQVFGKLAYAVKGLTLAASATPFEIFLGTEAEGVRCEASAVTIANLAPPTTALAQGPGELVPDDGLLDVTVVAVSGLADTLLTGAHLVTQALAGLPADRENVAYFRAANVRVQTAEPMAVMVDGDEVGTTPLEVTCVPASLTVLVPKVG